jgi:hypothetical protein
MANKKWWMGIPVLTLVFGMTLVGCSSTPDSKAPSSFRSGSGGDTTILLRQGLDFDQAFREVAFVLNRHGFDTEMIQPEVGYIRTRWITTWNDAGVASDWYRVRITCNFNPSRTQLIINAEAEYLDDDTWRKGYDTRAIETLRNDLNMTVGN